MKKGWTFIDSACYSDGSIGGDGHAIVNAAYSYVTACSPDTGDYSTVITNTTPNPITYCIKVSNLKKSASAVSVWETKGSGKNHNDENYFRKIGTQTPQRKNNIDTYCVTVQPYSIWTESARIMFYACMWFYIPLGLIFVFRNALQGLGHSLVPMTGGNCELIARGLGILFLAEPFGYYGICAAEPLAWFAALIPLIPYYLIKIRSFGDTNE